MENGDETLAHGNGGVAAVEEAAVTVPAKSYAAVAASAEIDDLRAAKLDLEEKLDAAELQNKELAAEAHRLEGVFSHARDDVATAEHAAVLAEQKVASLEAEVKRLQDLVKKEKSDREADKNNIEFFSSELEAGRQVKLKLEKEIEDLKASAAAAAAEEAKENEVPEEAKVAWQGLAAAGAAGAAATAAVVLIYLHLKKR